MSDAYEELAEAVLAIKDDESLRACFIRVLKFGSSTQQVRTSVLKHELVALGAPKIVLDFVRLLSDEKIAHIVLSEIEQ